MSIEFPNKRQYIQTNRSDIFGNIVGTFNVDLMKILGKLRITRMLQTTSKTIGGVSNADLTSFPVGFVVFNMSGTISIWTAAGLKVHHSGNATAKSAFIVDATSNSPVDCDSTLSDILVTTVGGVSTLFVTANGKLYTLTTSWTSKSMTLSSAATSGPWMMCAYGGLLYFTVSGLNTISSTNDNGTTQVNPTSAPNTNANTLLLDTNYRPTVMRAASNRIWIGTVAGTGKGYVYEWDGVQTNFTTGYRLNAQACLAMVIKDDVPWIIDSLGHLSVFSGGTFVEKARFPINEKFLLRATDTINDRFIHPNGMSIVNGRINILINNILDDNPSSIAEFCPSGIWEYDDTIGLYHKDSVSYAPVGQNSVTDFGQNRVVAVGGLSEMKLTDSSANATGDVLAGATIYTDATNTDVGIFTNDTFDVVTGTYHAQQGNGYVVTAKIESSEIQDAWQKIFLFYKQFLTSTDQITVKYRTTEAPPTEILITWLNSQTFTTTTDVRYLLGYEVEIIQGMGSGKTAHIVTVDATSILFTVHLDDTFTGVTTGTAKARLQAWNKLPTVINDQTSQFKAMPISGVGVKSSWIQFKICFQFTGPNEFSKALLINSPHQEAQ